MTRTFDLKTLPELTHRSGLAIGVDWGGSNLRSGLLSFGSGTARLLEQQQIPYSPGLQPDEAVALLAGQVDALTRAAGDRTVHGIGIGVAAMVDPRSGTVMNTPNIGFTVPDDSDLPLGPMIEKATGYPTTIHNDLSAIAWGERCFGAGRGASHLLCVFLGTGLGAAYVHSGKLMEGQSGVAVELGHVRVVPGGRPCGCGQKGCVEAYVGGRLIRERLAADLVTTGPGAGSAVLDLAGGDPSNADPGHVDKAARAGDNYAEALWDELSQLLARALAHAVTLLDPGLVVMGGTVWTGCPELQKRTRNQLIPLCNPPAARNLKLAEAELGDLAGVTGAAALAIVLQSP